MDNVPARIEHTVLGPTTTWADVQDVLDTATELGMRACIPPCYVADAVAYEPSLDITTVLAFPHGQQVPAVTCREADQAWDDGASEVDVVCNVGQALAGEFETIRENLSELVATVPIPVKVIVEAPLLDETALRGVCGAVADADASFLKTATGFSEGGATVEDVALMSEYLPVKASGGIGSWEKAERMFDAGAERIGASSGDRIVREYRDATTRRE